LPPYISGMLFAVRASALIAGMRWPRAAVVRHASYSIDSALLATALMLFGMLPAGLFANGWLWAKLGWVLAYIMIGITAFRPQRRLLVRALLVFAALCCFLQAYGIARTHHPLGWLLWSG